MKMVTKVVATVVVSVVGMAAAQTAAPVTPQPTLLVLSKHDHTLAMVDPVTLKVLGKAPVGDDPHEVIASADGTRAYVSNYGSGAFHSLAVIDLTGSKAPKALPSIDLGPLTGPHGLAFVGGKVWFTAEGAKAIGSYDPVSGKVDWILGTGQNRTHMIYVSPDEKHIVTTNVNSGTVSMIEQEEVPAGPQGGTRMDWNATVVKVGNGPEGFDMSPDGKEIWVANAQDGTVSVIDRAMKAAYPSLKMDVLGANRLKFTPDGKYALVSLLSGPDLVVLDVKAKKVLKRIPIGRGAAGIVIEPGGARAFVACTPDNFIAIVDLKTLTVSGHISAGLEPDGMDWVVRR